MIVIRGKMDGLEARRRAKAARIDGGDVHLSTVLFETITLEEIGEDGKRHRRVERTGNRIFNFRTHLR